MSDEYRCEFCNADPFEYVTVDDQKIPVAVACCDNAVSKYYQGLANLGSGIGSNLLKLGGLKD